MIHHHPMPGYDQGRAEGYFQGLADAFALAAKVRLLGDRLAAMREAHGWGCDCTTDDPCRILIALNGGPSRPQRDS